MKNIHPKKRNCKFIDATNEILKSYTKMPKRRRIKLNEKQLMLLEIKFNENHHPSQGSKEGLAAVIGIPVKNIQIWFQNRRAKDKAEKEDMQTKFKKGQLTDFDDLESERPPNYHFNGFDHSLDVDQYLRENESYNEYDYDKDASDYWIKLRK